MTKKISITDTAQWLRDNDSYLIITHRKPDGDAIGSAAALARTLRKLGKNAALYNNPEITDKYMPFAEKYIAGDSYEYSTVITVDTASLSQFALGAERFHDAVDLAIDHHLSNSGYAEMSCVEDYSACGEIILEIVLLLNDLDKETADCLYTAVSTDTGCFAYGNTNAATFDAAAKLAAAGADISALNKLLFRTKRKSRAMLEGSLYSNMRYYFDNRVAVAVITMKMREEMGLTEDDLDNVPAIPVEIEGVEAGVTIKELPDEIKISLRTGDSVDACAVCAIFGGGGHKQAAGCSFYTTISDAEEKIVEALGKVLD